ncbi:MAG: hypothetical protein HGB08_03130 [Candidatus Moranbacteria bacterium]|nr:hypothetical protein [Candidatus Moranbacteria bacterium]
MMGNIGDMLGLNRTVEKRLRTWIRIYREYFDLEADFSGITVPKYPRDGRKYWLIAVPLGISLSAVFGVCREYFNAGERIGGDFGDIADNPKEVPYAVWVEISPNPEEIPEGAYAVKDYEITLMVRLLMEILYHMKRTGNKNNFPHECLDTTGATLCWGSRFSDGDCPVVCTFGSCMTIVKCDPEEKIPILGLRKIAV